MKNDYDIAQMYREMELHLISSMQRNLGRHLKDEIAEGKEWKMWQAEKLKELKRYQRQNKDIVNFYTSGLSKDVSDILKEEFKQGHKSEINKYNKLFDKQISDSFFKLDDRKANVLINVVNNDLNEANKAVLRMMNDTYRQTVHKAATFASNGVMTQKQAVDMATNDFLSRGLNVIEYKDGKRVNIASYAQMAVRTASQRAMLMGEGEFRKSIGETNVIISKHGTACKLCVPHEGNVYIDDVYSGGKADGKHKLLSSAMQAGLFHPNCRHGISTYYGLDDEDDDETTVNVPAENNNEDAARLDREIQKEKRKVAGFQSPDNLKTAQQRLKELEDKKHDNVLAYYVSGEGMYINNALRGVNDVVLNDNDIRYIKDLDNALNSKLKTNMTVYRNVDATAVFGNMSETDFENLQNKLIYNSNDRFANAAADKYLGNIKGKVITDKGYLSTTKDYEIARDWGGFTGADKPIVLELEVPKGTKGRDLAKFDLEDDPQKEILLARNTRYKIKDVIAKDGNIYVKASVINDDMQDVVNEVQKKVESFEKYFDVIDNATSSRQVTNIFYDYIQTSNTKLKRVLFNGIDLENAKDISKKLIELDNTWNSTLTEFKFSKLSSDTAGMTTPDISKWLISGDDKDLTSTIEINSEVLTKEKLKEKFEMGYTVKPKKEYENITTFYHEYGHSILGGKVSQAYGCNKDAFQEMQKIYSNYRKELRDLQSEIRTEKFKFAGQENGLELGIQATKSLQKAYDEIHISRYADTAIGEFIAEAFVDAHLTEKPSKYSLQALDVLKKYYKKG